MYSDMLILRTCIINPDLQQSAATPQLSTHIFAHLEARWAPVDELNAAFGFDAGDGNVDILRHDVTTEQETTGHD